MSTTKTVTSENVQLPPVGMFLNSVCPGIQYLAANHHFNLPIDSNNSIDWPLTDDAVSVVKRALLSPSYLNISRPPLNSHSSQIESTTYVSLPFHILQSFKDSIDYNRANNTSVDGNFQIAANVNPLLNDPFKLVHLNPGCLSQIIEVSPKFDPSMGTTNGNATSFSHKNPFNKLSSNFNKLLKLSTTSTMYPYHLINGNNVTSSINSHHTSASSPSGSTSTSASSAYELVTKILDYHSDTYKSQLCSKSLLISVHVNVLNVLALGPSGFVNTKEQPSDKPIIHFDTSRNGSQDANGAPITTGNNTTTPTNPTPFSSSSVEIPLLRVQFRKSSLVVVLKSFCNSLGQPVVCLGFDLGEILVLNLSDLSFNVLTSVQGDDDNVYVTSIDVILHGLSMLVVAGYSNGEVAIFDPLKNDTEPYTKRVVGLDEFVTYFKKFDLSPFDLKFQNKDLTTSNTAVVGHFKVSHKPITSITSTVPYPPALTASDLSGDLESLSHLPSPMVLVLGSDDGFVRFIDLIATYGSNIDLQANQTISNSILTDIVSNYFNDGITSINFSPDFRFLCIAGKGDLIEVFKMTYYNVNGLLSGGHKHHHPSVSGGGTGGVGKRSRSGTLNSTTLNALLGPPTSVFLSPLATTPSVSFEMNNIDHALLQEDSSSTSVNASANANSSANTNNNKLHPPTIKDIKIVARFKGHTNSIRRVEFLHESKQGNPNSLVYKLISCGFDGKIIIWDFDYKALPKVKESHSLTGVTHTTRKKSFARNTHTHSPSPVSRGKHVSPVNTGTGVNVQTSQPLKHHNRTKSWGNNNTNYHIDEMTPGLVVNDNEVKIVDSINIINSLYKNLFELRLKKHYSKLLHGKPGIQKTVLIHPIVSDNLVPSIEIPLLELDLSHWVGDGKIEGFHLEGHSFWCFAKNGDIFRYLID